MGIRATTVNAALRDAGYDIRIKRNIGAKGVSYYTFSGSFWVPPIMVNTIKDRRVEDILKRVRSAEAHARRTGSLRGSQSHPVTS